MILSKGRKETTKYSKNLFKIKILAYLNRFFCPVGMVSLGNTIPFVVR